MHTFGSADNARRYRHEIKLDGGEAFSRHGVLIDDLPMAVAGACEGGPTTVHAHSAIVVGDHLYLAVGNRVVCFALQPFALEWCAQVDSASCFGLHYAADRKALICRGEMEITRFSEDGRILWKSLGRDIFTGPFEVLPGWIEARDFNDDVYRFDYETGASL